MLKIEEGKYYRTRDGRKVGPMVWEPRGWFYVEDKLGCWLRDGAYHDHYTREHLGDLIAEWTDGPVVTETVTKTRIVPGVYGCIQVGEPTNGDVCVSFVGKIYYSADELDAAAAVLSALAKGLRDA